MEEGGEPHDRCAAQFFPHMSVPESTPAHTHTSTILHLCFFPGKQTTQKQKRGGQQQRQTKLDGSETPTHFFHFSSFSFAPPTVIIIFGCCLTHITTSTIKQADIHIQAHPHFSSPAVLFPRQGQSKLPIGGGLIIRGGGCGSWMRIVSFLFLLRFGCVLLSIVCLLFLSGNFEGLLRPALER